ncbi:MAG TPA: hypothetical protein VJS63_15805 [Bradyrhizobium sp.]|nr:hypothetical protein [Bradyrhizobium sp.]
MSETKRPIPENRATETNSPLSDFVDDEVPGVDGEIWTPFGMCRSNKMKYGPGKLSWQLRRKFNATQEFHQIRP